MHLHNPLGTLLTLPLALISISSLSGLSPLRARQSHTPKGRGVIHVHGIWEQHPSGCLDTSGSFVYNDCAVFGARRLPGSAGVNFVSKNGVCEFTPDIFRCGEGGSGLEGAAFMDNNGDLSTGDNRYVFYSKGKPTKAHPHPRDITTRWSGASQVFYLKLVWDERKD